MSARRARLFCAPSSDLDLKKDEALDVRDAKTHVLKARADAAVVAVASESREITPSEARLRC